MQGGLTDAQRIRQWAVPEPELGAAVYRVTAGPAEHKHTYYYFSPWSPDGRRILLARYDRHDPAAEICLLATDTGDEQVVGRSLKWDSHTVAFQQWLGAGRRIFYMSADAEGPVMVTARAEGGDVKVMPAREYNSEICCALDARHAYAANNLDVMFPDDAVASRDDKGLWRIDLETGARQLVFSVEQSLSLLPDPEEAAGCHLFIKRIILHPRLPRLLFNLTNTFWDRSGEPRYRQLFTIGLNGEDPVCVGPCVHHPNWHPLENRLLANLHDFTRTMRFGLYPGDGKGLLEYVPKTKGSGHPSFSPDGRWLCTDAAGELGNQLILCNPRTGASIVTVDGESFSAPYASFKAIEERKTGETIMDALRKAGQAETWQTQGHPAWSRDGSAILFNRDLGSGSQLFMVDAARALADMDLS